MSPSYVPDDLGECNRSRHDHVTHLKVRLGVGMVKRIGDEEREKE